MPIRDYDSSASVRRGGDRYGVCPDLLTEHIIQRQGEAHTEKVTAIAGAAGEMLRSVRAIRSLWRGLPIVFEYRDRRRFTGQRRFQRFQRDGEIAFQIAPGEVQTDGLATGEIEYYGARIAAERCTIVHQSCRPVKTLDHVARGKALLIEDIAKVTGNIPSVVATVVGGIADYAYQPFPVGLFRCELDRLGQHCISGELQQGHIGLAGGSDVPDCDDPHAPEDHISIFLEKIDRCPVGHAGDRIDLKPETTGTAASSEQLGDVTVGHGEVPLSEQPGGACPLHSVVYQVDPPNAGNGRLDARQ